MHIPDGYLTGQAAAAGAVAGAAGLAVCIRRASAEGDERALPVAGLTAAFCLALDAPFFPLSVGTDGHLLGGTLAVALLGPWLGGVTMAVVTVLQALVLGDGGITTLGVNVIDLALLPALLGYPLILALRKTVPLAAACGAAAFATVLAGACCFVGWSNLGAWGAIDRETLAGTVLGTYAVVGLIEAVVTALIVRSLLGIRPVMLRRVAKETGP